MRWNEGDRYEKHYSLAEVLATFSVKGQIVNFLGSMVSVTIAQFCHCSWKQLYKWINEVLFQWNFMYGHWN